MAVALFACTLALIFSPSLRAEAPLTASPALILAGTHGKFDFIAIDPTRRRLLAAHTANGSLDVVDLERGELVKSIPVGAAQDCALDPDHHRYLVSVSKPPQLVLVDAESLQVTGKVALDGPADLLAYHQASGQAFVCQDDGRNLWVVSPEAGKIVSKVDLQSDSPEDLCFDEKGTRLFQAMKTASTIEVIDVAHGRSTAVWSTAPAKTPHGIAAAHEFHALLVSGGNGKMVLLSQEDGHVLSEAEIPEKVDEIAYDAALHRVYAASGLGKIAVLEIKEGRLVKLAEVTSSLGARSIAIDPKTHAVWIAYARDEKSVVQRFTP